MEYWLSLGKWAYNGFASGIAAGKRRSIFRIFCLLVFLGAVELTLRVLGLHTPVLYETTDYGYRVQPNQDIRRFGNRIFYNSLGLRSETVTAVPVAGTIRILCVGDSIANGGTTIDQADTYPYRLQALLQAAGRRAEVLNASAPGWAIANESGWLRENGTLGAQVVVLTINTLDLFQQAEDARTVDNHPSFPSHRPAFAVEELAMRYVVPWFTRRMVDDPGARPSASFSPATARENIARLIDTINSLTGLGTVPVVLFVEEPVKFDLTQPPIVEAKAQMFEALKRNGTQYMDTRGPIEYAGGAVLFRDHMHPNAAGNQVLAETTARLLASELDAKSPPGK